MDELTDFEKKQAAIFKVLSEPVRLKALKYLKAVSREVTCGEIGKELKISKTSGSYHFKLLQDVDLITVRKQSREKYVKINEATINDYITRFYEHL